VHQEIRKIWAKLPLLEALVRRFLSPSGIGA